MMLYSKGENGDPVSVETVTENIEREPTRVLQSGPYSYSFSHFLPYKTRPKHPWRMGSWDGITQKRLVWFDTEFDWRGEDSDLYLKEHRITMPRGGTRKYRGDDVMEGDAFCEFLGWFISEGHISRGIIGLTQKRAEGCAKIKSVLKRFGVSYHQKVSKAGATTFLICHQSLMKWLKENCYTSGSERGALRKRVPNYVGQQTSRRINLFLDAYVDGDGFRRKDKYRNRIISTSSTHIAGDIQALFLKVGRYATARVHARAGSQGKIGTRVLTRTADNYQICEWRGNAITHTFGDISERVEPVYEVKITGPTKLFMVKFGDDRPMWTHNGGVYDQRGQYAFIPVNAGRSPMRADDYPNIRSELWFHTATLARAGLMSVGGLSQDVLARLEQQAMAPEWRVDAAGRRVVEPKDATKHKIGRSPDDVDACNLAYYPAFGVGEIKTIEVEKSSTPAARPTMQQRANARVTGNRFGR